MWVDGGMILGGGGPCVGGAVSLDDTKNDTRHVGRGLRKGLGVLLLGVMASFLSKDAFGHDDGNRAIVAGYFR